MDNKEGKNKKKIVVLIIVIILLILITCGLVYYFSNPAKSPAEPINEGVEDFDNVEQQSDKGRIEFIAKDQDDIPVVGMEVCLEKKDGTLIGNVEVGNDGKITFYNVQEGDYVIRETKTAEGYSKNDESVDVSVKATETSYATMKVDRIVGVLNITLVDDANEPLSNGSFNVYDSEGYLITTTEVGADGGTKLNIGYGTYYFKQASGPEKYVLDDTMYKFTVDEGNKTFNKTVMNIRYKGSLYISVNDNEGNAVEGVSFNIFNENGDFVSNIKTNEIGRAGVSNMPFGKYVCKELQVPDGFQLNEEKIEFEIAEKDQVIRKDIVQLKK